MTERRPTDPPVGFQVLIATFRPTGEPLTQNEPWLDLFGQDDRPWARLSDQDQGLAAQCMSESASGSLVTNQLFLVRHPRRDHALPVLLNFIPILLPTDEESTVVTAIAVTGEVLTEPTTWLMSQTQRHRMETLGRMTMGIAHDFNNLLSGILGHAELLRRTPSVSSGSTAAAEHVQTIEQAALDGAALIRKIQQYIRQEKQIDFELVDLRSVIQDSVTLTRPYWYNEPRRQGIATQTEVDLGEIPLILGSASELRDVFVNLILNAVQAMPSGGVIRLSTRFEPESGVIVEIADTGTGMTDRVRARIFEPMFTTKGKSGTGMGLAVCYGTVQEHEGEIDVETRLGYGTKFTITFPATPDVRAAPEADVLDRDRRSVRILVVDDEPMVRRVLDRLLSLRGHEVVQADSGEEALAITSTQSFDVIITDQGMPDMSGRQLAHKLRSRFSHVPIILLTGDTEAGTTDRDISLVLSKPFKSDMLERTIQTLVDSGLDHRDL
jgi:signal transduction histidine kinase/CheY-like chemotaxis protein